MSNPANRYNWDNVSMPVRLEYAETASAFLVRLGERTKEEHAEVLEWVAHERALLSELEDDSE